MSKVSPGLGWYEYLDSLCWYSGCDVHLQDVKFQYDVTSLFSIIAMGLACGSEGVGGSRVS